jgi:hypothetical protein
MRICIPASHITVTTWNLFVVVLIAICFPLTIIRIVLFRPKKFASPSTSSTPQKWWLYRIFSWLLHPLMHFVVRSHRKVAFRTDCSWYCTSWFIVIPMPTGKNRSLWISANYRAVLLWARSSLIRTIVCRLHKGQIPFVYPVENPGPELREWVADKSNAHQKHVANIMVFDRTDWWDLETSSSITCLNFFCVMVWWIENLVVNSLDLSRYNFLFSRFRPGFQTEKL